MHDKPSLFSSRYLGRNGCQADNEKLKITLKQKTISQISRSWDNILVTLTLDCGPSSFDWELSLSPFRDGKITLRSLASVEPIYKKKSKFLDYVEFCTNEGIRRKNFGK